MTDWQSMLHAAREGMRLSDDDCLALCNFDDLGALTAAASNIRDRGHGALVSYSRKVFIPLTKLCRDSCHYCTFAHPPRRGERCYLTADEVLAIAQAGVDAGCREALFTLGDKPELRYRVAREELENLGHATTISYLLEMAGLVQKKTGLLPHLNPGVSTADEIRQMRGVSVSQGIMLETAAERLSRKGGPHYGSPDKLPAPRLDMIRTAGKLAVPFTSGILIGIGETRRERIEALLLLRQLHDAHGHIQEIIVQNFRAKDGTRMVAHPEPSEADHLWTVAMARLVFGAGMNIQAPPNLSAGGLHGLVRAGINDWGGVSPVTPDHVNPERPWPHLDELERETAAAGKILVERLAIYPQYVADTPRWVDPQLRTPLLRAVDSQGLARANPWIAGASIAPHRESRLPLPSQPALSSLIDKALAGGRLGEDEIVTLFESRGERFHLVCEAADALRQEVCGDDITYVVTRNINYTNVCTYRCKFCAFSKGKVSENLRGLPYDLSLDEIQRRVVEAWDRGAVEVCMQGGIHPDYDGNTYLAICRAIKDVCPDMHVHAFSPLEIWQGANTSGRSVADFLRELKSTGLGSLPGTAAEILDDEIRAIICPDKVTTAQWFEVVEAAHRLGLRTTATIMFGHVDGPQNWARHLISIRDLQERTGGFTEFVPLPFVPMETPINLRGLSRLGPTYREAVLMHAIARLALHPVLTNIQTSWVKMGPQGAAACLQAGANDLGGTLMNESITRAAGATHGQEMPPEAMEQVIRSIGRTPRQRTTLYQRPADGRVAASFGAADLTAPVQTPLKRSARHHATGTAQG